MNGASMASIDGSASMFSAINECNGPLKRPSIRPTVSPRSRSSSVQKRQCSMRRSVRSTYSSVRPVNRASVLTTLARSFAGRRRPAARAVR